MQLASKSSTFVCCIIHVNSQSFSLLYLGTENGQKPSRKHFDENNILKSFCCRVDAANFDQRLTSITQQNVLLSALVAKEIYYDDISVKHSTEHLFLHKLVGFARLTESDLSTELPSAAQMLKP